MGRCYVHSWRVALGKTVTLVVENMEEYAWLCVVIIHQGRILRSRAVKSNEQAARGMVPNHRQRRAPQTQ